MQNVKVFRCKICGDPYIGFDAPSTCPFCGAHNQYLIPSEEWRDTNKVDLTDASRKNLQSSLELEISNSEFYLCVSKSAKKEEMRAMFKALYKVESEHASTICKILRIDKPKIAFKDGMCTGMAEEDILEEADRRENRAVRLYTEFLKQATEPRVKEFFTALIEIESDHIDLVSGEMKENHHLEKGESGPPDNEDILKDFDKEETDYYESYRRHED